MRIDWRSILPTKIIAVATSLEHPFEQLTSGLLSTATVLYHPANWVKIGPLDVQIKGLTESLKKRKIKTWKKRNMNIL